MVPTAPIWVAAPLDRACPSTRSSAEWPRSTPTWNRGRKRRQPGLRPPLAQTRGGLAAPESATSPGLVYTRSESPLPRLSSVRRHNARDQAANPNNRPSSVSPLPPSGDMCRSFSIKSTNPPPAPEKYGAMHAAGREEKPLLKLPIPNSFVRVLGNRLLLDPLRGLSKTFPSYFQTISNILFYSASNSYYCFS